LAWLSSASRLRMPTTPPTLAGGAPGKQHQPLPEGWKQARDNKGRAYYYHSSRKLKQWERPQGDGDEAAPGGQQSGNSSGGAGSSAALAAAGALVHALQPGLRWAVASEHRSLLELHFPEVCALPLAPPVAPWAVGLALQRRDDCGIHMVVMSGGAGRLTRAIGLRLPMARRALRRRWRRGPCCVWLAPPAATTMEAAGAMAGMAAPCLRRPARH
jgi:hypothetical protein